MHTLFPKMSIKYNGTHVNYTIYIASVLTFNSCFISLFLAVAGMLSPTTGRVTRNQ